MQVLHQLLLEHQQLMGAAAEGGPVTDLIVPGLEIPQHQINGIEFRGDHPGGICAVHGWPVDHGSGSLAGSFTSSS